MLKKIPKYPAPFSLSSLAGSLSVTLLLTLSGCGEQAGGEGLIGDFKLDAPIAYVKRPMDLSDPDLTSLASARDSFTYTPGGNLFYKEVAKRSSPEINLTGSITEIGTDTTKMLAGDVSDPDVSYDGRRIVFSMKIGEFQGLDDDEQPTWNIWIYDRDSGRLVRAIPTSKNLIAEKGNDFDPSFLPDGRIVFSSDRQQRSTEFYLEYGFGAIPTLDESRQESAISLHVMDSDGQNLKQISFNQSHDRNPSLLSNGKVIYSRWEHAGGKDQFDIYQVNPDGTGLNILYGAHSHGAGNDPVYLQPREMPDGRLVTTLMPASGTFGKSPDFEFYPAIKQLTLDLAASVFLGVPLGPEADKLNKSFVDSVQAAVAVVRAPIPGTKFWRGVRGRKYIQNYLREQIPQRRDGVGEDMFTLLCQAEDDGGNRFTDDEVINHMNFLMMAAHDTLTSSLTTLVYHLGRNKEWQEILRNECRSLGLSPDELSYDNLADLQMVEWAFKEALRINPPVPMIPRLAVRDVEFGGFKIPAGTSVGVSPGYTHKMPELWENPENFEPDRFSEQRGEDRRHKFAWAPYGGGAHMCIGLHFAYMQAKVFTYQLLMKFAFYQDEGYEADFQVIPIPKPKDGMPVHIRPVEEAA